MEEQPGVSRTMLEFTSSSRKQPRLIVGSSKIYGMLRMYRFFLGLEKKDHLAELLDVGARCIWMWFALFLNNRQF